MFRVYRRWILTFCVLNLLVFQLPISTSYAGDRTLKTTVKQLSALPEEMQLEVLSKLIFPLKQQLHENIEKIFSKKIACSASAVSPICFSLDGSKLAFSPCDRTIKIWEVQTGKELCSLKGHTAVVRSLCFSPDGSRLASGSHDPEIKIWDTQTGKELKILSKHKGWVSSICFSPDGSKLAVGSSNRIIRIWDTQTWEELQPLREHGDWVSSVCFSPDGLRLASGLLGESIRMWDVHGEEALPTLTISDVYVNSICFSKDGLTLASGEEKGIARIWDANTGKLLKTLEGEKDSYDVMYSISFSPDGSKVAAGTKINGTVEVWDAKTGKILQTCMGHEAGVPEIGFSRDGSKIASRSWDETIRIWDIQAREELMKELDRLNGAQSLLLCILYQSQEGLEKNEVISLSKTETELKQEYQKKGEEVPPLLNLKEIYDTLSPGLKKLVSRTFRVIG